jgi:hypothetical protein
MFSAGLFTPATDGSQWHVSPLHAGRLQDLPLSLMPPSLPPDPDAKEETTCASPSFVLNLGLSFAGRLSAAAGGSFRRPEAVGQHCNERLRIEKMHMLDIPKSGRRGDVVFFMIRNRQRERAYVIPKSVRNAATRRARAGLSAPSRRPSVLS